MQNVLSRYGFLSNPALSEGDILQECDAVQVVSPPSPCPNASSAVFTVYGRVGVVEDGDDIQLATDFDYVRRMPAASAFGVKCVNCSALEGRDSIFDKAAFVQCVRVDKHLNIHVVRNR